MFLVCFSSFSPDRLGTNPSDLTDKRYCQLCAALHCIHVEFTTFHPGLLHGILICTLRGVHHLEAPGSAVIPLLPNKNPQGQSPNVFKHIPYIHIPIPPPICQYLPIISISTFHIISVCGSFLNLFCQIAAACDSHNSCTEIAACFDILKELSQLIKSNYVI